MTPIKQLFAPTTPPTTGHVTRSATKKAIIDGEGSLSGRPELATEQPESPMDDQPSKRVSPFDHWRRTKSGPSKAGRSKKRYGDAMEKRDADAGNKKLRSGIR